MSEQFVSQQVYLDANATTPVLPQAAEAAMQAMKSLFGNPSSSHITGLKAKDLMEQTRAVACKLIGSGSGKLIFTSGATEGIQTAILSALVQARSQCVEGKTYSLLYGATEHKAVPESLKHWNRILELNAEVKAIPVDSRGVLDFDFIAREVPDALMICTMAVNNETGVYQDLAALDNTIRQHNKDVFWMVDCVQALGKRQLALAETSIDYAPFSGHKLYAPKGIGFLYAREGAPFTPFIAGGGQEGGLRSGTENLPGQAALKVILEALLTEDCPIFASTETLGQYRQQLADALKKAFPQLVFNHDFSNSVPTTLNFSVPGFASKEIMDLFDAANIRVSSGSACSSKVTGSFVLDAMGLPAWQSESAIRMSFGPATTQAEIDMACERIVHAASALEVSCLVNGEELSPDAASKVPLDGLLQFKSDGACSWVYCTAETKQAVVIDPLPELTERIGTLLQCQQYQLMAALDTHGHADHESGRKALAERFSIAACDEATGWPQVTECCEVNGEQLHYIKIGGRYLLNVATPGHTADSQSYLLCNNLPEGQSLNCIFAFTGDTVLSGTLGRTDFAHSSARDMFHSLHKLWDLIGPETLLCASHDYLNQFTSNLGTEVHINPLLSAVLLDEISEQEFVRRKSEWDLQLDQQQGQDVIYGATGAAPKAFSLRELTPEEFKALGDNVQLMDIREPHEYALQHTEPGGINVPLTRLVQFIAEHRDNKDTDWVLVCRSGGRSRLAAEVLKRMGFASVSHLRGGYALHLN